MKIFNFQILKFLLVGIMSISTALAFGLESRPVPAFKIVPSKEDKNLGIYIGFQILPNNSIWFYECEKNKCRPIFEKAIPKEKFESLVAQVVREKESQEKNKPWRDFFLAAGVTHVGMAFMTGIAGTMASLGAVPVIDGIAAGAGYFVAPVATGVVAAMGIGAGEGAVATAIVAGAGVAVIGIAVVGGLAYIYYQARRNKASTAPSDYVMEMDVSKDELMMMIRATAYDHHFSELYSVP